MPREPQVVTEDVRRVLRQVVQPDDPDQGEAVTRIAERANTSTRTIYRMLAEAPPTNPPHTITLELADRLVIACDRSLAEIHCRVVVDGQVLDYLDA